MPTIQELQSVLGGIRTKYQNTQNGGDLAYTEMADYIRRNNVDPSLVAQATAGGFAPNQWNAQQVVNKVQQSATPYGMTAADTTLRGAMADATSRIDATQNQVAGLYEQGQEYLNPYRETGGKANDLQAALSGALGPEAQQKAYADYQSSPGAAYALQEGEKAVMRNSAATGALGGGNTLRELQSHGIGQFLQDYQNQYARIGDVAARGYGAATTGASMFGQQAGIQGQLGQYRASIPMTGANLLGGYQMQVGRDIAQNDANVRTGVSNLQSSAGDVQAQQIAQQTGMNIDLIIAAQNGNAQAQQQLAAAGVNLNNSAMNAVSGTPQTPMAGSVDPWGAALGGASLGADIGKSFYSGTPTAVNSGTPAFSVGQGNGTATLGGGTYNPVPSYSPNINYLAK